MRHGDHVSLISSLLRTEVVLWMQSRRVVDASQDACLAGLAVYPSYATCFVNTQIIRSTASTSKGHFSPRSARITKNTTKASRGRRSPSTSSKALPGINLTYLSTMASRHGQRPNGTGGKARLTRRSWQAEGSRGQLKHGYSTKLPCNSPRTRKTSSLSSRSD